MATAAAKALISGRAQPDCGRDPALDPIEAFKVIERQSTAPPAATTGDKAAL
jgi:hypothetical protein